MADVREEEIKRLVGAASRGMLDYMLYEGHGQPPSLNELYSAYLTLAYNAMSVAREAGANMEIFRTPVARMYALLPPLTSTH